MDRRHSSTRLWLAIGLLLAAGGIAPQSALGARTPFRHGDVFLTGSGSVREYTAGGRLVRTVPRTSGAGGLCFDPSGALLILPGVGLFDRHGKMLPSYWARVPDGGHCVADQLGDVYVSDPIASGSPTHAAFTKYDLIGDRLEVFTVTPFRGIQPLAIDLAQDQCTIYYGDWDGQVGTSGRLNTCTNTLEPSAVRYSSIDDLRILPNGQVLVTDDPGGVMFDTAGQPIRFYPIGLHLSPSLRYMSLDPDGRSFWMSEGGTGGVVRFDIANGALLAEWGTPPGTGAGGPIAVYGGAAHPPTTMPLPRPDTTPSPPQIRALLSRILVPHGKTAEINALLSRGGYSFRWSGPSVGRLVISWYESHTPTLVATLSRSFSRLGTVKLTVALTRQGRQLLKSARRMRLIASGSFTPRGRSTTSQLGRFALTR